MKVSLSLSLLFLDYVKDASVDKEYRSTPRRFISSVASDRISRQSHLFCPITILQIQCLSPIYTPLVHSLLIFHILFMFIVVLLVGFSNPQSIENKLNFQSTLIVGMHYDSC
jgi:hypothetical protein